MGNSASTPGNGRQLPQRRAQSPSPTPGAPHRSLRTKKKSLELPDLASLSITSGSSQPQRHPKTPSIPIPNSPAAGGSGSGAGERGRPQPQLFSSTDLLEHAVSNNQPYPPRGTPYYRSQHQQQVQQRRIQELYNQSHVPATPQDHHQQQGLRGAPGFAQEVVRSSIPVALEPRARLDSTSAALAKPVPTKIVWRGGGYNVVLARAGDDEWKGRRVMEREAPGSPVFQTVVDLLPGTHHIRFLVDDQWRVADDLPTAVDDQGSLANYVAVPFTPPSKTKDPSFFVESAPATPTPPSKKDVPNPVQQEQWTNVLPPELLEAFKEEEMYLAAQQGQPIDPTNSNPPPHQPHPVQRGFIPAPNIPPAPALPRHLDKLILNMRVSPGPAANAIGDRVAPVGNAASVLASGSGVGSGQGGSGRPSRRERGDRERTREERREERRRGRERGYSDATGSRRIAPPPPPPPPTEIGESSSMMNVNAILAEGVGSPMRTVEEVVENNNHGYPFASRVQDKEREKESAEGSAPTSAGHTGATTTPTTSSQPTPLSSPPLTSATPTGGTSSTTLPVSSRTITIDAASMPPLTDDASVLPVPSHVVLHHLCTSAIKNGVLAVASTTRYRKKYLTTIYYKPT